MKLLIVESPTKVKTIGKYLGKDYKILASFGHVRDLPSKNGSIDTDNNFEMKYQIKANSVRHINEIVKAAKASEQVLLATDPDREGEAISWNIAEILKEKKAITSSNVFRVSFTEITPSAVKNAILNPRTIDLHLVDAQKARLSLDYLVGFNLSPVLWRKLPGSRSAGRVQSVALRLIAEREKEIKQFNPKEYWSIDIEFSKDEKAPCLAKVIEHNRKKINKEYPSDQKEANRVKSAIIEVGKCVISNISEKDFKQNPYPPFMTSTLQQAAFQSYSFASKKTMRVAQTLYEGIDMNNERIGLITYMRTDGLGLSNDAIKDITGYIAKVFGSNFVPSKPNVFKTKIKNAQEAHEAIRPTDVSITPDVAAKYLDTDELKLYTMIWRRAVACQMVPAVKTTKGIEFRISSTKTIATMSQTVIKFAGFLQVYKNATEEDDNNVNIFSLPDWKKDQEVDIVNVLPCQHFTLPPPRFNDASLIKKMEELGIGRPSTYSSVVSIVQDRGYVVLSKKQFYASMRGMVVSSFLKCFAKKYVEYDFTASLEQSLDNISSGESSRADVLREFWDPFKKCMDKCMLLDYHDTSKELTEELKGYLFHLNNNGSFDNECSKCKVGKMMVNIGKFGPYLRCSEYPDCSNTVRLSEQEEGYPLDESPEPLDNSITHDGATITLKKGPYGRYLEVVRGDDKRNKAIPKEISDINEETMILYGSLPKAIGLHPDNGKKVNVGVGKFGPYIEHSGVYVSIKTEQIQLITLAESIDLITKKEKRMKSRSVSTGIAKKSTKKLTTATKGRKGSVVKKAKVIK
ncbi:MAG: type I DNA topoisomerase [Alphaproteobacteria bacterium]|nr:type I DNA topoisomerase [Rickettsiales bacterium]